MVYGKNVKGVDLGIRESFTDIASTIEELLLGKNINGSFKSELF